MSGRRRALLPVALCAAAVTLALPGRAAAHALLISSDPPDGARLASSPQQIRLEFSEEVSPELSRVSLTGAHTGRVGGVHLSSGSGSTLEVSVPHLGRDTYILRWRTVSEDDLHPSSGSVVFGVGVAAAAVEKRSAVASEATPATNKAEVAVRWVDFAAIAALIGALALIAVCVQQAARRGATGLGDVRRKLARLAAGAAVVALCTGIGLLLLQAHGLPAKSFVSSLGTVLTGTTYGPSWIAREVLLCALFVVALMIGSRRPGVLTVSLTLLVSAALCVSLALNSHSAATRGLVSMATAALALHLMSAALWAGGVGALALVLAGEWRQARAAGWAPLLLRSFSGLAALSVAVLALTGLYSAGVAVASPEALVTTLYGRTLLAKTALFMVIGAIGLSNSLLVRSGLHRSGWLRRGVRVEAAVAAGVILFAALLTSTAPPREPRLQATLAREPAAEPLTSAEAGDLLVSLSVKPNAPGVNFLTAGVFDTRRPPPAPIRAVDFRIGGGSPGHWLAATRARDGYWQLAGSQLNRVGAWPIGVRIHRPVLPTEVVKVSWTVGRPQPDVLPLSRTADSGTSLAAITSPVAIAGALALAVAFGAATLTKRGLLTPRRLRPVGGGSRRCPSEPTPR